MAVRSKKAGFEFISRRKQVIDALDKGYERNLQVAIRIWQRSLLGVLSGRRSGKIYKVPGTSVDYRASAPGEAPAPRTGTLRASYYTEVDPARLTAFVGSELDHSLHMERGTKHIKPRPALEPAFRNVESKIRGALGEPIEDKTDNGR